MSKIAHITRRERFSAAHKLWREEWSEEKNAEVFGSCSNPNWHGHNYELFVTVSGPVDETTGFVANLKDISRVINEKVISKLDHKNINLDVDFMQGKMATTEVLTIAIWDEIEQEVTKLGSKLRCVKVVETENNYAEYYG